MKSVKYVVGLACLGIGGVVVAQGYPLAGAGILFLGVIVLAVL